MFKALLIIVSLVCWWTVHADTLSIQAPDEVKQLLTRHLRPDDFADLGDLAAWHGELYAQTRGKAHARLGEQDRGTALALGGDHADRDERQEERNRKIVGAERRDDDPVERREPLGERGRPASGAARLGVGRHRGEKSLAHERADHRERKPERPRREQLSEVEAKHRPDLGETFR